MIEFDSVSKIYPEGNVAVKDFSLRVPPHSIVVLVGSSGSGKTTLLRMVNRMVTPSKGRVLIDGEDVTLSDPIQLRRSIGYVLQSGGLLPHRRILDNITIVPRLCGTPRKKAKEDALGLLELVGLDSSYARRYPSELSGGQLQRVGVARALAVNPSIMLMDEPFGAVDPIVRRDLQDELLRLHKELGTTTLFITHDIEEAFRLGDIVVVLREGGEIAQSGTPDEILGTPANEFVANFVGTNRGERLLSAKKVGESTVVYDSLGRPAGVLE